METTWKRRDVGVSLHDVYEETSPDLLMIPNGRKVLVEDLSIPDAGPVFLYVKFRDTWGFTERRWVGAEHFGKDPDMEIWRPGTRCKLLSAVEDRGIPIGTKGVVIDLEPETVSMGCKRFTLLIQPEGPQFMAVQVPSNLVLGLGPLEEVKEEGGTIAESATATE